MEHKGIQLLGQIRHGSCRPRAILFKVLADSVGLESKLVVVMFHSLFFVRYGIIMDLIPYFSTPICYLLKPTFVVLL